MKVVSGATRDGSRTAFLIAEDMPRGVDRPTLLIAGAWCSLAVGIGWLVLIIGVAIFGYPEEIGPAILAGTIVPFFGIVMAARLIRDDDDIAAMISLVPLHLFGTLPMLAITLINPAGPLTFVGLACVTALTAAPPLLFWLDARSWSRS